MSAEVTMAENLAKQSEQSIDLRWSRAYNCVGREKNLHMNEHRTDKDEERLNSFLKLLFGMDSGALIFFLWFVRGDILGNAKLPFRLAFLPFKTQVLMLAGSELGIILLLGFNIFLSEKQCFRQVSKLLAFLIMIMSIIAIGWGGWSLIQNPDFLSEGRR